jgi:Na+/H+ antiporter NhaD/arsenite permease-like protein
MSDLATIATYSVFIASYVVFALGKFPRIKIDRPGAAITGAVLMFTFGAVRAHDALQFIHFGTIVLPFSTWTSAIHMIVVRRYVDRVSAAITAAKPDSYAG